MINDYVNKFLIKGKIKEQEFAKLFKNTQNATISEDMREHWDIAIKYNVDVKSLKKLHRSDSDVNEFLHWIEILNVNGKPGWAYGEADYFAFELKNYWIIVDKFKLQDFIAKNVTKEYVLKPEKYKLYKREGRRDCITLVESLDLLYISECQILKKI